MSLFLKLCLAILCLLGVGTGFVTWKARQAEAGTEAQFPPIGEFLEVGGQRVHAVVQGDGPDVVLIHGASSNLRDFTFAFVDHLSDRYRVIVLDRPGFGYSDPLPDGAGTLADQAALLSAAAQSLGADNPIVLGHSYGGSVAMAWGLAHPAAALVIESGATMVWPTEIDQIYKILASPLGKYVVAPLAAAFLGRETVDDGIASTFSPEVPPQTFGDYLGGALALRRSTLLVNARQRVALKEEIRAQSARYGTVMMPVEVIHGDSDATVSLDIHARGMSAIVPDAALTVLPGVGHNPHNSVPVAVAAAVDRAAARAGLR